MTPLRQRMLEDMQMRNLAPLTQSAYVRAVAQLAQHYGKAPDRISREEVRAYLLELIQQRQVSASRYNQVRCARRFFYQVTLGRQWTLNRVVCQKTGRKLPVVLSRAEVVQFFGGIRSIKYRALFLTLYAAGLRVSEVVTLRVRDIDCQRILHTWGQNLHLHPHLHCVVPGGGLAGDGTCWMACRPGFFLLVRV